MSLRSVVLTGSAPWRVPNGVSFVWANQIGSAGGGQGYTNGAGGSASGSGEFTLGLQIPVTPNTIISAVVGVGGIGGVGGASNGASAADGGPTSFNGFQALGTLGVPNINGVNNSGAGGGPNGGVAIPSIAPQTDGNPGGAESPTCFGGASGGTGEGLSVSSGGAGGQQIGQFPSQRTLNTVFHPSGSGGCSIYGAGGFGTTTGGGNSGGGYGAGASGISGQTTGTISGGTGANGVLVLFYMSP